MPIAKITSVTVSHIWDDESESENKISLNTVDENYPYVSLNQDSACIQLRPESWTKIKDQIDSFMATLRDK
jgi:hypothetical protein